MNPLLHSSVLAPTRVYKRPVTTTDEPVAIPAEWLGGRVVFEAIETDIAILFGDATVEASTTAASSLVGLVMTLTATSSVRIPAGTALEVEIPVACTHFSVEGLAAGHWAGWRSV